MDILFIGPFALGPKHTVSGRALPMAEALAGRGHRVRLVIPPWDRPADSGQRFTSDGVRVEHIALPPRVLGVMHAAIVWRLLRVALGYRFDVIHVFKPKGYAGCAALLLWYLKRLGIMRSRLVVDTDDWEGPGGWNERGGYSKPLRWFFAGQERWGLAHCDGVTAASRTLQSLAWSLGAPAVLYLPNGLPRLPDLPSRREARGRLGVQGGPLALVYTRFVEAGPDRLAAILGELVARVPQVRISVVGQGLGDELARLGEQLSPRIESGHIRLAGWVGRNDLPSYWAAADFALYACADNLLTRSKSPLRLVEMMGAGLAVAAHGVGEVNQYLEDGFSGRVVAPGDDLGLVGAAAELARNAALRAELGTNARDRVNTRFLWYGLVERLEAFYEELGQSLRVMK